MEEKVLYKIPTKDPSLLGAIGFKDNKEKE